MGTTTIISDIHLGSDCCQTKSLSDFLDHIENRSSKLVLNGDVFDSMDLRKLRKHHWGILSRLRKVSENMEVVWVAGNHDGSAETISHLLGLTAVDDHEFTSGSKRVLVFHGHIFDSFIYKHPTLTWIGDTIYSFLQRIDTTHCIARMVKHSSKEYLRCAENIKQRAIKFAEARNCDVVCCGHVHHAEMSSVRGVEYVNSGCWTEKPSSFIDIHDGKIELGRFSG